MVVDTPGSLWVFGLLFVSSGTLVLSVPFFADGWATFRAWERAAVLVIGLSHLAAGLWTIRRHPATRTELDRATGMGSHRVRRAGSGTRVQTNFPLADVSSVHLRQSADSDGDPMYQLQLSLADHRVLLIQGQPAHGEALAREHLRVIRSFLGRPASG